MRRSLVGMLILLLLPLEGAAQTFDLYKEVRNQELRQAAVKVAEPVVRHFASLVAPSQWPVWVRDVNYLLQADAAEVCSAQCENGGEIGPCINDANIVRPALSPDVCGQLEGNISQLVAEEEYIRSVGRRLMAIAASQEGIVSERPDDPQNVAAHFAAIKSIWTPGEHEDDEDSIDANTQIRIIPISTLLDGATSDVESALGELESALQSLVIPWPPYENDGEAKPASAFAGEPPPIEERMTAAVWRYQFGLRLLNGEREPHFPAPRPYAGETGTGERQYLHRDWPEVEYALERLWNMIPQDPLAYFPPLAEDDIVIISFGSLPLPALPNVSVWARMDGNVLDNHPHADIGLQWVLPREPVLPSLLSHEYLSCIAGCNGSSVCAASCASDGDSVFLGGTYPPEPIDESGEPLDGRGLCSQPFAATGYLCRPLESGSRSPCTEDTDPVEGAIILTSCTEACPNGDTSGDDCERTLSGPDVCAFDWIDSEPDVRHGCSIEFTCGGCDMGDPIPKKAGDGTITVCPDPNTPTAATYGLLYSLTKASQACDRLDEPIIPADASDDERRAACCSLENEAYHVMCLGMSSDGLFVDEPIIDGIPINTDTCAEMMADYVCNDIRGYGECAGSWEYTDTAFEGLLEIFGRNPKGVPDACFEATQEDTRDTKVGLITEALENATFVCSPGRNAQYRNSIGNNLCYVGQCIEQGMETHRIVGGNMPLTVNESAYPNMLMPMEEIPGGLRFAPIAPNQGILPVYMPGVLLDAMETRLCQTNSLPPLLPVTRCGFDVRRAIYEAGTMEEISAQNARQQRELAEGFAVQAMGESFGIRMGADFTAQYLAGAAAPLTGVVRSAAELLTQMTETEFPSEMCPLGP